jgi:hypothetical protein
MVGRARSAARAMRIEFIVTDGEEKEDEFGDGEGCEREKEKPVNWGFCGWRGCVSVGAFGGREQKNIARN